MRQIDMLKKYEEYSSELKVEIANCKDELKKANLKGQLDTLEMVIYDINEPVEHPIF